MPVTFPKSVDDLPPYDDYALAGRTYRYMEKEPLFPFGFGLGYTTFAYSDVSLEKTQISSGEELKLAVMVENTGKRRAEEVVQMYISDVEASVDVPKYALKGFTRILLWPRERKKIEFTITPNMLEMVDNQGEKEIEPGMFKVFLGGSTPSNRSISLGAAKYVEAKFQVN